MIVLHFSCIVVRCQVAGRTGSAAQLTAKAVIYNRNKTDGRSPGCRKFPTRPGVKFSTELPVSSELTFAAIKKLSTGADEIPPLSAEHF